MVSYVEGTADGAAHALDVVRAEGWDRERLDVDEAEARRGGRSRSLARKSVASARAARTLTMPSSRQSQRPTPKRRRKVRRARASRRGVVKALTPGPAKTSRYCLRMREIQRDLASTHSVHTRLTKTAEACRACCRVGRTQPVFWDLHRGVGQR